MAVLGRRCTGLLAIHGIGVQTRGEMRKAVLEGLHFAYPSAAVDWDAYTIETPDWQVRVYEVHWADAFPDQKVEGSFRIDSLHEAVWFPCLNFRRLPWFRERYRRRLVAGWTLVLIPLAVLLDAAYRGAYFLATLAEALWRPVSESFRDLRSRPAGPGSSPRQVKTLDSRLNAVCDRIAGDVPNYVNSAGLAAGPVPGAEAEIYQRLESALRKIVEEERCTEIQVLAHSLGSLIAYRALTLHHDRLSALLDLPFGPPGDGRLPLTGFFTAGSPLEKIRFFWPKLFQSQSRLGPPRRNLVWHNFKSRFDLVAGMLTAAPIVASGIENHRVSRAGGLLRAHTSYLLNRSFLEVLGPSLTGKPIAFAAPAGRRLRRFASGVGETLLLPASLAVLSVCGLFGTMVVGNLAGFVLSRLARWGGDALNWVLTSGWTGHQRAADWLTVWLPWAVPFAVFVWAIPAGFSRASRNHRQWLWSGSPGPESQEQSSSGNLSAERNESMENENTARKKSPGTVLHLIGSFALLIAIAWIGLTVAGRATSWVLILVLMTAFAVLNGQGITGSWRGILIDARKKMSLSRLQMVAWTLLILSALLTAILSNVTRGSGSPLEIVIPQPLWILMGISAVSGVGAPAVLGNRRRILADPQEREKVIGIRLQQGHARPDDDDPSVVLCNKNIADARWSDLLKGDETGNGATVDLGKLQMFLFTFVLVSGYGAALYAMFLGEDPITALPPVQDGMNVLLGISQTGYLTAKAAGGSKGMAAPAQS